MQKWEYKVESLRERFYDLEYLLNYLGDQGWELVNTISPNNRDDKLIFKRLINTEQKKPEPNLKPKSI